MITKEDETSSFVKSYTECLMIIPATPTNLFPDTRKVIIFLLITIALLTHIFV